jgi:hypothetical protein
MTPIAIYSKGAGATLDYQIDWATWLGADTISLSIWAVAPAGLTLFNPSNTTTKATIWAGGGTVGTDYVVTNTITTAAGRIETRDILINIAAAIPNDGAILTVDDFGDIRTKLGVTSDDLSDLEISSIGLLIVAEAMIQNAVPTWATLTGINLIFLRAATVALCGALAVRSIELKRGQSFAQGGGDYSESATKASWDSIREELLCEAKGYLLHINVSGTARPRTTIFLAAGPTSGGTNWPSRVEQWYARVQPTLLTWLDTNGLRQFGWEGAP